MQYSRFGMDGRKASRLGFGCMRFPMLEDGKIDRAAASAMVDAAYQAGVNYFDTAYGYHDGESEPFMGEALARYPRDSFQLATKLPIWLVNSEEDVERLFEEQRQRCRVDYFDVYLVHALDRERWALFQKLGVYEKLQRKKEQGLIHKLGFSYHGDFETFCSCVDAYPWDAVQLQLNYVDDTMQAGRAYHDKLCEKNIPCIIMEPVRGGFLADLPEPARKELRGVNGDPDVQWALRWCMDLPNTPVILSGMSTLEQVRQNLTIFSESRPLSAEERDAIERAREAILQIKTVPCTACGYCMDCSFGVNIPAVFEIYNQYKLFQNAFRAKTDYEELEKAGRGAGACTACGACAPMCPQGIAIPDRLSEVHREIDELVI